MDFLLIVSPVANHLREFNFHRYTSSPYSTIKEVDPIRLDFYVLCYNFRARIFVLIAIGGWCGPRRKRHLKEKFRQKLTEFVSSLVTHISTDDSH